MICLNLFKHRKTRWCSATTWTSPFRALQSTSKTKTSRVLQGRGAAPIMETSGRDLTIDDGYTGNYAQMALFEFSELLLNDCYLDDLKW